MYSKQDRTSKNSSNSSNTPAPNRFAPRPFAPYPPSVTATPQQQTPDLQTQKSDVNQYESALIDGSKFIPRPTPARTPRVQMKLTIGQPGDKYEQEADRVASQVVQKIHAPASLQSTQGQMMRSLENPIQAKCEACEGEEKEPQPKPEIQTKLTAGAVGDTNQLNHLVQQTSGVSLQSEQHLSGLAKPSITAGETQIQRYTEVASGSKKYRIADDKSTVVQQDSKYGSQALWTEAGKAQIASKQLEAAQSVIRLEEAGSPLNFTHKGKVTKSLQKIKPKNVSNKTSGTGSSGMELWADCGKSARDVIGAGKGTGQGAPKGVYTDPSGKSATTAGTSNPASMKREILLALIFYQEKTTGKKLLDQAMLKKMQDKRDQTGVEWNAANKAGKDKKTLDDLATKYFYWDQQMTSLIVECYYTKISDKDRAALDKQAGTNEWADPGVGEGYTISSGGADKPGAKTWNFHWAGVVINSNDGNDHVTLENYAVGDADVKNTEWVYQMYGSAKVAESDTSKKGQTFHEQHRDLHGQHGETPTTMKVKPK